MVIINTVLTDSFRASPFLFIETGDDERDFMTTVYILIFFLYEGTASVFGAN